MEILCLFLWILITVISKGLRGELDVSDEAESHVDQVSSGKAETLEFVECSVCGKPNPVEGAVCSACGAPQTAAQT